MSPWFIARSNINGFGVFSQFPLPRNKLIGICHWWNGSEWETTSLGKFYNHSTSPNAINVTIGHYKYLFLCRDVKSHEEITVDYRLQPDLEQPLATWR